MEPIWNWGQCHRNERPVLSSGVAITNWQVGADGVWKAPLPEVKAGQWHFTQLFVNDLKRAAGYPQRDVFEHQQP